MSAERTPRVIRDGKVAVLISPGFGAGWSTWATAGHSAERMALCPTMVEAIERGVTLDELRVIAEAEFPGQYMGGLEDLRIEWVPEGSNIRVAEYDGSESIDSHDDPDWFVA